MDTQITNEQIEATETFKGLEKCFRNLLLKSSSKKDIDHGLIVYRSTGVIPGSIGGNNLRVLKELIENETDVNLTSSD